MISCSGREEGHADPNVGSEKEGSGVPGFSSHLNGTEATSLTMGVAGNELFEETTGGFQSFLGIPGLSSHRNGTAGGSLGCFLLEFAAINFLSTISAVAPCLYIEVCWIRWWVRNLQLTVSF